MFLRLVHHWLNSKGICRTMLGYMVSHLKLHVREFLKTCVAELPKTKTVYIMAEWISLPGKEHCITLEHVQPISPNMCIGRWGTWHRQSRIQKGFLWLRTGLNNPLGTDCFFFFPVGDDNEPSIPQSGSHEAQAVRLWQSARLRSVPVHRTRAVQRVC